MNAFHCLQAVRGVGLALALVAGLAVEARAQMIEHVESAREAYRAGVEAYNNGEFQEAARLLRQAYARDPNPRLAFNTGRAYELAEDYALAIDFFRLAVQTSSDAEFVAVAEEAIVRAELLMRAAGTSEPGTSGPDASGGEERARPAGAGEADAPTGGEARETTGVDPSREGALFVVPDRGLRAVLGDLPPAETPISRMLPPGTHRVEVQTPEGEVRRYEIVAEPGTTVLIRPRLQRTAAPVE